MVRHPAVAGHQHRARLEASGTAGGIGPDPDVDHYLEGVRDQLRTEIDAFLAAVEKLVIETVPPMSGFGRAPQWPTSVLTVFRRCDLIADGLAGAFDPARASTPPGAVYGRLIGRPSRRQDAEARLRDQRQWRQDGDWFLSGLSIEPTDSLVPVVDWPGVDSEGYARVDPGARLFVDRVRATGLELYHWVRLSPPPGPQPTFPPPESRDVWQRVVVTDAGAGTWPLPREYSTLPLRQGADRSRHPGAGGQGRRRHGVGHDLRGRQRVAGWFHLVRSSRHEAGHRQRLAGAQRRTPGSRPRRRLSRARGARVEPFCLAGGQHGLRHHHRVDWDGGFERRAVSPLLVNERSSAVTVKVLVRSTATAVCTDTPMGQRFNRPVGRTDLQGWVNSRIDVSTGGSLPLFTGQDRGLTPGTMDLGQQLGPVTWPPPDGPTARPDGAGWLPITLEPGARCSLVIEMSCWLPHESTPLFSGDPNSPGALSGIKGLRLDYSIEELRFAR